MLPHFLQGFAGVAYTNRRGETLRGRTVLDAVGVVYADRGDEAAARELSLAADVRIAWGGREAVEAIVNLPRRYGTEDLVFGPKTSLAVVGAERLGDEEAARRTAAAIAADASAFDQQGCNSPHTVFVERGGAVAPAAFASCWPTPWRPRPRRSPRAGSRSGRGDERPRGPERIRHARGGLLQPRHELDRGLQRRRRGPGRAVFPPHAFRPARKRVLDVADCSPRTQTAGLAVDQRRLRLAEALTARGVERCPNVGAMRLYETPWDGLFPMDRLVRWVSSYRAVCSDGALLKELVRWVILKP